MLRRLAPLLAFGLVLTACGSGGDAPDDAATVPPTAPSDVETPSPGATQPVDGGSSASPADAPAALQFSAPLVGGGDIELTTLAGRPVLLWFWAPW